MMSGQLYHHGIKGMKWGVRRTPEQLGHATPKKLPAGKDSQGKTIGTKKIPGKSSRKWKSLSDEELQERINRLNMQERYADLLKRQKDRENTGVIAKGKKLLGDAAEDLGKQLLSKAVSKLVDKIAGDRDIYDIDDPTKATTSDLKKATDRLNAIKNYKDAKNPREPGKTDYDYDDPTKLSDATLAKVVQRIENENKFHNSLRNKNRADAEAGRGPVQDSLAKMAERDAARNAESRLSNERSRSSSNVDRSSSSDTSRVGKKQVNDWVRQRNRALKTLRK